MKTRSRLHRNETFLDFQDVNKNHLENLIEKTRSLEVKPENLDSLALLKFDEPSTRTRLLLQ